MASDRLRVAVLLSRLSGYMAACLKALKERHGASLLVVRRPPAHDAPFEDRHFAWMDALHDRSTYNAEEILALVESFHPDAVLMSGWLDAGYLRVARRMKQRKVPVIAGTDTQWTGSFRQQVGRLIAPWYLHSAIDALWVAGERQRQFAHRLGFRDERCWSGIYACDWDRFADVHRRSAGNRPPAFLYVGRYISIKGIDVLVEAYRQYRTMVRRPWPLICAGAGTHKSMLAGQEGIVDKGFIQPDDLPALMETASAFILPSRREPWGVVVQEAAASGLALLCSDACGAAVHLVQDGYNGFLFGTGNARHLAQCMARLTEADKEERATLRSHSHLLSKQFTPQRWADTLVQGATSLRSRTK